MVDRANDPGYNSSIHTRMEDVFMDSLTKINNKQREILDRIADLNTMLQGTISAYNKTLKAETGSEGNTKQYYVLTRKDSKQKTVSESIPAEKLDLYNKQTDNYRLYRELTKEYQQLAEDKARLELSGDENGTEQEKKTANRNRTGNRDNVVL